MDPSATIHIFGIKLSILDTDGLIHAIDAAAREGGSIIVASGNTHSFNLACREPWFKAFLNRADIVRIDSVGVRLGARILGHRTPPRNTWADFAWKIGEMAEAQGHRLYFLGGGVDVAAAAANRMRERFPGLCIAGAEHGYFLSEGEDGSSAAIQRINEARADILIVGMGMPRQEQWLNDHADEINVRVIMTAGAVFDYLSDGVRRAPKWMLRFGLEWCFRLWLEPGRMWTRYVVGNPLFICRAVRERLSRCFRPRAASEQVASRRD